MDWEHHLGPAVDRLRRGGLVAFPTETVYGLGADALSEAAVGRVFETKGRPSTNPLIVHVSGPTMARRVAASWPPDAQLLADHFWPGPLSIILPRAGIVPAVVTAGGPTVALRCPDHDLALDLLGAFDGPLVGPSANRSGSVSPTTAEHVRASFTPEQVMVLDGGPCRTGIESTVVRVGEQPVILRPGAISATAIARVLGRPVSTAFSGPPGVLESPGQLEAHYAPGTRLILVPFQGATSAIQSAARVVVLTQRPVDPRPGLIVLRMPLDAAAYAAALYARVREADLLGAELIVVVEPDATGGAEEQSLWGAVMDRLRRSAAAFR